MVAKRILIAEAHPMCAIALNSVIHGLDPSIHTVTVDSLVKFSGALAEGDFDLITTDLDLGDSQGLLTVAAVRDLAPNCPVLVVTDISGNDLESSLQSLGTKGYISKFSQIEKVGDAISALLAGGTWFSPESAAGAAGRASSGIGRLSSAQLRVLREMSGGHSNKEIAFRLGLAEQTVKTHVSAILRNLGVSNRSQAILLMREDARIRSPLADD